MSLINQRNNDEGETGQSIENAIFISFSDNDQTYDLEIKNISAEEECLQITIVSNSCSDFYYGITVENGNFPESFATVFGSPMGLYEYIVQECENALEIEFQGETNQKAILKITVLVLKKNRCLKLIIPKQPLTQEMRDKANLQKLNQEIQKLTSTISFMAPSIGEAQKELAKLQAEISQQKQQQSILMQQWFSQLQQQSSLKAQNFQIQKNILSKKQEVRSLLQIIVSLGIQFNEEEISLFHRVVNGFEPFFISSSNKKRRTQHIQQSFLHDSGCKIKQKESRKLYKNENTQNRVTPQNFMNKQQSKKIDKEAIVEKIKQMTVNQNNTPQFPVQKMKNSQVNQNKPDIDIPKTSRRVLQINSDISSHQSQLLAINPLQKPYYGPFKQQKIEHLPQKSTQIPLKKSENVVNQKQLPIERKQVKPQIQMKPTVVILSSPSEQDEEQDSFNKLIGTKIELDLSACDHLNKYKVQRLKSRVYVERINPDKLFYNLYHSQPIKGRQNMQLTICQANKNDINVGIMYKDVLKTPRIQGPKEVISWVGCYKHIVNQLDTVRVDHRISASDSITVSADTLKNTVSFYVNKKLINTQLVKEKYMKNAHFFFQTATLGNKLYYL